MALLESTYIYTGYLDGYLLQRTCVFKALRLFFLPNFPGPTVIPRHMSIPEARVGRSQLKPNVLISEGCSVLFISAFLSEKAD